MKINNIANQSFGATLKGDYKEVIKLSAGNGLKIEYWPKAGVLGIYGVTKGYFMDNDAE